MIVYGFVEPEDLFVVLIYLVICLKSERDYKQAVKEINFEEINTSAISDGVYTGECNVDAISGVVNSGKVIKIIFDFMVSEVLNDRKH